MLIREFKRERGCYYCARLPFVGAALSAAWPAHVLQLHHRDPATKDPMFHRMERWAVPRILAELEKCDVLCANHHAMEHWGR